MLVASRGVAPLRKASLLMVVAKTLLHDVAILRSCATKYLTGVHEQPTTVSLVVAWTRVVAKTWLPPVPPP